jgi:hypothetical protein
MMDSIAVDGLVGPIRRGRRRLMASGRQGRWKGPVEQRVYGSGGRVPVVHGGRFDRLVTVDHADIMAYDGGGGGMLLLLDVVDGHVHVGERGRAGAHQRQRRDHGGQTTDRR